MLSVQWIHGSESSEHNTDPDIQVFWYDDDTVILRQNKAINYEAPFLYLLFGARVEQCSSIQAPQPHLSCFRCGELWIRPSDGELA